MKIKIVVLGLSLFFCSFLYIAAQPSQFFPKGMGGGGALFSPTINPANDNEFYVSCDMSELFHSTDFGLTYTQVDFTKLQVFGKSTYEFTNDPNIAYCNFNDGNDGYPVKTTDGGVTWNRLTAYDVSTYGTVYSIKSNYSNPSQLIIGGYGDIFFSGNGGVTFSLVRHTANMGAGIIIGGVFWDGQNIYIGTNEGILYSSNGGTSFSVMTATGIASGQVLWSFAGAKAGGTTRFVCITANSGDVYNIVYPWEYYNFARGVYVMDNANGTWVSRSAGLTFSNDYLMYAAMAWNDIGTIYLGGHDVSTGGPLVYKSTDGGSSWVKKFNTTNNANIITAWEGYNGDKNWSWSETCFGISVAPYNSSKVMFGNFSNVQLSTDGGNNWKQAYVSAAGQHPAGAATPKNCAYRSIGLENTTCWQVHWQTPSVMIGCFSDIGGIRSTDTGNTWGYQYTGLAVNSLYRVAKGSNGNIYGACSNIHDMYQSTRLADVQIDAADGNGKIVYSTNDGATWATLHTFSHPVYTIAIDPNHQNRMYASVIHFGGTQGSQAGGIYCTNDLNNLGTSTWTKLPNPPRTEGHPADIQVLNDGKVVCSFSGRRNSSGTFQPSSGVFLYDPTLNSWTDVSNSGMYYWTQDVVIDPSDATQNTWYVCVYSGWGGAPNGLGGLYKTTDRGASWNKLTASTFDRVMSITFNPLNTNQVYLTTETQGLWVSGNIHNPVPDWSLVTSYPFRQPLRVFFNPYNPYEVWVTSFGNGMKVGSTNPNGIPGFQQFNSTSVSLYPNPSVGRFMLRNSGEFRNSVFRVTDMAGNVVCTKQLQDGNRIENTDISFLSDGAYFWQVMTNNEIVTTGKLFIIK